MKIRPQLKEVLGMSVNQLESSLAMLDKSQLDENQRFHLRQVECVLCPVGSVPELEESL